jgi:hypothetical protein
MKEGQQQFQCTGDCLRCLPVQRQYCAAQHAYSSMMMLKTMQDTLEAMTAKFNELNEKINAIQDNDAMVFNPSMEDIEEDIAQEGDGAEE